MNRQYGIVLIILIILLAIYIYINKYKNSNNIFKNCIYLDNNGTTQMSPEALKAYNDNAYLGNASASYANAAKYVVNKHDDHVLATLGVPNYRVIHTSGASESNNTILKTMSMVSPKPHFILSSYEHVTSLDCAKQLVKDNLIELSLVDPNLYGQIQPADVVNAIKPNTVLVSIMHINNETGNVNDISAIAVAVKKVNKNIIIHSDIVQSFGKYSPDLSFIDAVSASYHKVYGPTGVGILVLHPTALELVKNHPLIHGEQNFGARGGTLNIAGIAAGCAALVELEKNRSDKNKKLLKLKKKLLEFLSDNFPIDSYDNYYNKPDTFTPAGKGMRCVILGEDPLTNKSAPNTLLMAFVKAGDLEQHFCNIRLKNKLMDNGIITSIGSTCHSASKKPSHVMYSIKAPFVIRCGVIRVSFGDYNTSNDVDVLCRELKTAVLSQL